MPPPSESRDTGERFGAVDQRVTTSSGVQSPSVNRISPRRIHLEEVVLPAPFGPEVAVDVSPVDGEVDVVDCDEARRSVLTKPAHFHRRRIAHFTARAAVSAAAKSRGDPAKHEARACRHHESTVPSCVAKLVLITPSSGNSRGRPESWLLPLSGWSPAARSTSAIPAEPLPVEHEHRVSADGGERPEAVGRRASWGRRPGSSPPR